MFQEGCWYSFVQWSDDNKHTSFILSIATNVQTAHRVHAVVMQDRQGDSRAGKPAIGRGHPHRVQQLSSRAAQCGLAL